MATDTGVAPVFREVARLVADPKTSTSRLAAVVAQDRRLASTILKKANSSYYFQGKEVTDVGFAVTLLGFNTLRETVASVIVSEVFRRAVTSVVRFEDFWNHSIACALIARALAERFRNTDPMEAFVAGLLHDIGVLVMEDPPGTGQPWKHAEAGSKLAARWGLAESIARAIQWHHNPENAAEVWDLAATIHVADILSNKLHPCHLDREFAMQQCTEALHAFGFYQPLTESVAQEFASGLDLHRDSAPSFDRIVLDLRQQLIERVQQLPPETRLIFILYYYEGLSFEEIGSLVGSNEQATAERLQSALVMLQEAIVQDITHVGSAP
jgi:putative nucleotidyltransferase with HDIG domain